MLTIRPIAAHELDGFARFSRDDELNAALKGEVSTLWEQGSSRPEWCFVAEEDGQILGRICYWGLPTFGIPSVIEFLLLPWDADYRAVGPALLQHTLAQFHSQGVRTMAYLLPIPSRFHDYPAQRAGLLEAVGFSLTREGDRWESLGEPVPVPFDRLWFRSVVDVGEPAFIEAIRLVTEGTLDRSLQNQRTVLGPERAARETLRTAQALSYEPSWWHLAYTPGGTLVGLVMAACNDGGPILYLVGVVPVERGQGYGYDLVAHGTCVLRAAGFTRIVADSDTSNIPVVRALEKAGYQRFLTRFVYTIDLTARAALHRK
ncbi:MAG TPA: GNAT family N-acetyltransferase [Chloroflexota bacterium]|nr:GNAT family N-acetyltransferase [Chloroflexota bacterium]